MSDKIICLVGESGSGKTTIARLLDAEGYNVIQSYTTREERQESEWGHTFVNEDILLQHEAVPGYIMAYKKYCGFHYWATKDQYLNCGTSIYVVDPDGVDMLLERVNDAGVVIIYLNVEVYDRITRMQEQGRSIQTVCDRVSYDNQAFRIVRCNWVIDAEGTIEETLELVKEVIRRVASPGGEYEKTD
jgi:guanylate kinase